MLPRASKIFPRVPSIPGELKAIADLSPSTVEPQRVSLRLVAVISTRKKGQLKVFESARLIDLLFLPAFPHFDRSLGYLQRASDSSENERNQKEDDEDHKENPRDLT